MSRWSDMPARDAVFTVIDFETTGVVESCPDEPWQIGMVRVEKGAVRTGHHFMSLLRVGDRPFNPNAPGRHTLLRDQLAASPRMRDIWPLLEDWLVGYPLVAHNAGTEKKILRKAAPLHRLGPWIDTLKLARIAYPDKASHSLGDLLADLGLLQSVQVACPGREEHDALFDAYGSAVLLTHLLHVSGWEGVTVDRLASAHPEVYFRRIATRGRARR